MLIAQQLQAAQTRVDNVALVFVAARIGYVGAYLADLAALRSTLWVVGLAACIVLYFLG